MIENGCTPYEIIKEHPSTYTQIPNIERAIALYNAEKVKNIFRKLEVVYIWGQTGVGKTRYVLEKYGYTNVYRVTNYQNPFDGYKNEDVILFDEFRSNLRIDDMLKYLDGYPVNLPSRYTDKPAAFTKVYIISNIPIYKKIYTRTDWINRIERRLNMFDEYPDILTVSDIQRALGIGRNTAYKLLKSKQIKSIRIGNKYKIPKRCLIAYALQIC